MDSNNFLSQVLAILAAWLLIIAFCIILPETVITLATILAGVAIVTIIAMTTSYEIFFYDIE